MYVFRKADPSEYMFPLRVGFKAGDRTMMANWFDYKDPKYVAAYVLYKESGAWPKWVQEQIDEGLVVLHEHWELMICECMADAWIREILKEHVDGLPVSSVEKFLQQVSDT